MKVYLAGGMKSWWRSIVKKSFDPTFEFLDPCNHELSEPSSYTFWDMQAVKHCDLLFGYFEKDNPSGIGLSCEIGYALGLGKPVILVNDQPENKYFLFVENAGVVKVSSLEEAIRLVKKLYLNDLC